MTARTRVIGRILALLLPFVSFANASGSEQQCSYPQQTIGAETGDLKRIAEVLKESHPEANESDCYGALSPEDRQLIEVLTARISQACGASSSTEECRKNGNQAWLETLRGYKDQKGGAALDRVLTAINAALQERHFAELKAEFSKPGLAAPFNEFARVLSDFHAALDKASYQESRTNPDGTKDASLWGRAKRYTSMYLDRQFDYWLPRSTQDHNRFTQLKKAQAAFSATQKRLREQIAQLDAPAEKKSYLLDEVDAAVRFTNAKIVNANQEFEETRIGYLRPTGLTLLSVAAVGAAIPAMSTMVGTSVGAAGTSGMGGLLSGAAAAGAGTAGALGTRAVVGSVLGAKVDSEHKQSRFFCELTRRKAAMGADLVSEGWKQVATSMVMGTGVGGALAVLGKLSPNASALVAGGMGVAAIGKEAVTEWRRQSAHAERQKNIDDLVQQTPAGQEGRVADARHEAAQADAKAWTDRAEAAADLAPLVIGGIHGLRQQPASAETQTTAPRAKGDAKRETWRTLARNKKDPLLISSGKGTPARFDLRAKEVARRLSQIEKSLDEIHPLRTRKAAEILRTTAEDPKYLKALKEHLGDESQALKVISEMKKVAARAAAKSRDKLATLHKESLIRSQQTVLKHETRVLTQHAESSPASVDEIRKSLGEIDEKLLKNGLDKPKDLFVFFVDDARKSANANLGNYVLVSHPEFERRRALRDGLVIDGREAADHEYGHAIFSHNLRRYQDGKKYEDMKEFSNYSKLWGKAFDVNSSKFRMGLHQEEVINQLRAELARKQSPGLKDRIDYWSKAAEIKFKNWRTSRVLAPGNKMTSDEIKKVLLVSDISGPYQEVFSDLITVAKRGEQKAIGETLTAFRSNPYGRTFEKRFKRSIKLTKKTPNQGEHHALDGIRNKLWHEYFSDPRAREHYPEMFDRLHRVMAQEIFERAADPKLHQLTDAEVTRRLSRKLDKELAAFDWNANKGG